LIVKKTVSSARSGETVFYCLPGRQYLSVETGKHEEFHGGCFILKIFHRTADT
jgi:hypothetical protein